MKKLILFILLTLPFAVGFKPFETIKKDIYDFAHPIQTAKKEVKKTVDEQKDEAKKGTKKLFTTILGIVASIIGIYIFGSIAKHFCQALEFSEIGFIIHVYMLINCLAIVAYRTLSFIKEW